MGLLGCPESFQRLMENINVYISDLLVHSKTHEDHLNHLDKLFSRLRNVSLKAKLHKCEVGAKTMQYLGFRLTPECTLLRVDTLKALKEQKCLNMPKKCGNSQVYAISSKATFKILLKWLPHCITYKAKIQNGKRVQCQQNLWMPKKHFKWLFVVNQ
jgi:hypothetical protein